MSECKSCGAHIRWAKTESGKAIPVNPVLEPGPKKGEAKTRLSLRLQKAIPVNPVLEPGGNIEFDNDGTARVVQPLPDVARFVSHFATCPHASSHRRRKKP